MKPIVFPKLRPNVFRNSTINTSGNPLEPKDSDFSEADSSSDIIRKLKARLGLKFEIPVEEEEEKKTVQQVSIEEDTETMMIVEDDLQLPKSAKKRKSKEEKTEDVDEKRFHWV